VPLIEQRLEIRDEAAMSARNLAGVIGPDHASIKR
jgi:hypothetical protein